MPYAETDNTWIKLDLVTTHAQREPGFRFTSLAHLLNKDFLRDCFELLDKKKAVGIDGITWEDYAKELEENLDRLVSKLKRNAYKPLPSRRVYIRKNEHELRPLGISAIESKIVESGIARILTRIYEADFLDCSHGFRPLRSCHTALTELDRQIMFKSVNHIVEADIKGYFDRVSHTRLLAFLRIRIADGAMMALIEKFLKAGFIDKGEFHPGEEGTPQGSILSPLLSNVYLHYTLDRWFQETVKTRVRGYCELIRYADDFVCVVQYQDDARMMMAAITERLAEYGLELHPEKSRCISFGHFEPENAARQGRRPNTFDFLGFTHFCDHKRKGGFKLGRKTSRKKFARRCREMHEWLKSTRNAVKTESWWKTLKAKLRGHYQYYGVSGNFPSISRYFFRTLQMTRYWLNRRSQRNKFSAEAFRKYLERHPLPRPEIKKVIYVYA